MDPNSSSDILTQTAITGPSAVQAGLAGAALISSAMNLAISASIAASVAALHKKMDRIEAKIDYVVQKVDRIDTQVAENNLRHAVDHMLRRAVMEEDRIDLKSLAAISSDLNRFMESLPGPLFLNFSLVVSSDVRERIGQLLGLLSGVRQIVAQSYNLSVGGNPERVVVANPDSDYFCPYFGGDLDTLVKATTVCKDDIDVGGRKWYDTNKIDQFKEMGLSNLDDYLPEPHSELFEDSNDDDSYSAKQQRLGDLVRGWLYQTDAGMFFRTELEMNAITDGYENVFWPKLVGSEPCHIGHIDVSCEVADR